MSTTPVPPTFIPAIAARLEYCLDSEVKLSPSSALEIIITSALNNDVATKAYINPANEGTITDKRKISLFSLIKSRSRKIDLVCF